MTYLIVCAHDVTSEFETQILADHNVTIKDRSDEPWSVVFEGDRAALIDMFSQHWTNGDADERLSASSPWLTDVYVAAEKKAAIESGGGPVAMEGEFNGLVLGVSNGLVTQKVNRDGSTVQHDQKRLSKPVAAGDVVEIRYSSGVGVVVGKGVEVGVGR